jgi:hypothetical protein
VSGAGEEPLYAAAARAAAQLEQRAAHAGPGGRMRAAAAVRDMSASLSGSLASAALLAPGPTGLAAASGHAAAAADCAGQAWQELARHQGRPAGQREAGAQPGPEAAAAEAAAALEAALARAAREGPRAGQVPAQLAEILVRLARACGHLSRQGAGRQEAAAGALDRAAFHLRAAAVTAAGGTAPPPGISGADPAPGTPTQEEP